MVGASTVDCDARVRLNQLDARSRERASPHGTEMLHADGVHLRCRSNTRDRAVVAAHAKVVVRDVGQVVAEAERLIERDGVVEHAVHEHIVARRLQIQRARDGAGRHHRVQVRRVVRVDAEDVQEERALLLDDRAAEAEAVVDVLLGASHRHERTRARERTVAHQRVREVPQRPDAGLRDDLDGHAARAVELGGELIAGDADRSDHRLRRQRAALEAVDADDRAGTGHVLELLLQDRRIVRERVDLIARQHGAERRPVAVRRRLLFVLLHGDRGFHLPDREHRDLAVVASADTDVRKRPLLEARELDVDRVAAGRQSRDGRHAGIGRSRRRNGDASGRVVRAGDGHGRADDHGVGLIDDGDAQRAAGCRLCDEQQPQKDAHFSASNFFGSIFTLMLTRSNVVSSMVDAAPCRDLARPERLRERRVPPGRRPAT